MQLFIILRKRSKDQCNLENVTTHLKRHVTMVRVSMQAVK